MATMSSGRMFRCTRDLGHFTSFFWLWNSPKISSKLASVQPSIMGLFRTEFVSLKYSEKKLVFLQFLSKHLVPKRSKWVLILGHIIGPRHSNCFESSETQNSETKVLLKYSNVTHLVPYLWILLVEFSALILNLTQLGFRLDQKPILFRN